MSIEQAIIARSRPYVVTSGANALLRHEAYKCCTTELSERPVNLEPVYVPCTEWQTQQVSGRDISVATEMSIAPDMHRYQCLISEEHGLDWCRAERFLKELSGLSHWVGFEITGDEDAIVLFFLILSGDLDLVRVAFEGEFPDCEMAGESRDLRFDNNIRFFDFLPASPYHHLQTQPETLQTSPYDAFIRAIAQLPASTRGFMQVLFEPVRANWHQNVHFLTDIEFLSKAIADPYSPYRAQQMPSGELKDMTRKTETKAHYDKPLYFAALRAGIVTTEKSFDVWPLVAFANLFHRDGQPFQYLTELDYQNCLNKEDIVKMFRHGQTYRPGFLVNSSELAAMVHLPSIAAFRDEGIPIGTLEKLRLTLRHGHLMSGIEIGKGWYKGSEQSICINEMTRKVGTHIIGRPGTGKTTTIEHMILQDIKCGRGVAYLDPHGDSVKRLLRLVPPERIEATIYLDFGDPDWVPLWNPLEQTARQHIGRKADDLVAAIKSIVKSNAWGDRLEHILRNGFYGLLHLEHATFFDLLTLFAQTNKKDATGRQQLKRRILQAVDNEVARIFWQRDYDGYRRDDFAPPLHKLSKLLTSDETVSLMLTQPENRLDFEAVLNEERILLLDLSNLGPDTKGILGCFLLAFLHNTALSRSRIAPEKRKNFSIYCDEAYKMTTDTLENMIAESRKFGISLTLAHQFLNQFKSVQRDALSSVGTTIIFNVDIADAHYLKKDLQGKVEATDLATLKTGEAIARIETDIVKIKTPEPPHLSETDCGDEIVNRSRQNYCRTADDIRNALRNKHQRPARFSEQEDIMEQGEMEGLSYDVFD
jgi:hypothetical protein